MSHSVAFVRARVCALCALCALSCSEGVSDTPAFDARMRLANAQFVAGPTPAAEDGPEVNAIDLLSTTIWPGYPDKAIAGALGASATAAVLALSTDVGYWIVPAGAPAVSAPTLPTFRTVASFSSALPAGDYTLEVRAVDAAQRFGPPSRQILTALTSAPSRVVLGALVITLTWDTESDLDLHVIDPLGNEIYHGAPNSTDAFKSSGANASNGTLDADSNANCEIDGLRQEDVTWADAPPSGHYLVRVDTASLRGTPSAHWTVRALLDGTSTGQATGVALDSDTRGNHDRGAGLLVLELDLP